jgi:hypothetical protein
MEKIEVSPSLLDPRLFSNLKNRGWRRYKSKIQLGFSPNSWPGRRRPCSSSSPRFPHLSPAVPLRPPAPLPPFQIKVRMSAPLLFVQIRDRIQIRRQIQFKFTSDSRARGQFSGQQSAVSNATVSYSASSYSK